MPAGGTSLLPRGALGSLEGGTGRGGVAVSLCVISDSTEDDRAGRGLARGWGAAPSLPVPSPIA